MSPSAATSAPDRRARAIVVEAVQQRVCPAAVVEVGSSQTVFWREAFGTLTFAVDAPPATDDTVFDLASLTKPVATTTLVLGAVSAGHASLDERAADVFPDWTGTDREGVLVRDLLEHASGLPARLLDRPPDTRREFEHEICRTPLAYVPRMRALYSDLGFILLGFLVERRGGRSLAVQFDDMFREVREGTDTGAGGNDFLAFGTPFTHRSRTAPTRALTDDARRGQLLTGTAHDEYAALLGGAAGHAGLFGNVAAVGRFAQTVLRGTRGSHAVCSPLSRGIVALATARSTVPGSSRALGWDTMLPTSSCGTQMSQAAFGHVGFTGTSLWIDPQLDRYFILLTNRACDGGTSEDLQRVRRAFHDAAIAG
jgi:CubicO group peptidase (beta-lactamase class C family)